MKNGGNTRRKGILHKQQMQEDETSKMPDIEPEMDRNSKKIQKSLTFQEAINGLALLEKLNKIFKIKHNH